MRRRGYTGEHMGGTRVRILLARHGETVFNVDGRWQGQSDSPLTERGLAQSRELARALASENIAAVYSSDLGRALATASQVAERHNLRVTTDERLREINTGEWTSLSRSEIDARWPDLITRWSEQPSSMRLPGGETVQEAQHRALSFFSDRMPNHLNETIVVISHGAIGQAILVKAMGRSTTELWLKERVDNTQISRLEWSADHGLELKELSDVRHLEDVGSLIGWRTTDAA